MTAVDTEDFARRGMSEEKRPRRVAVHIDWPYRMLPKEYVMSLLASDVVREPDVFYVMCGGPVADAAANVGIKYALDHGADEIVGVSVDQTWPSDFLARMRAHGKEYVTGLTATRQPGHHWLTYQYGPDGAMHQEDPTEPLQKVAAGGMGCFYAKRSVFEKMPAPWFYSTLNETGTEIVRTNDFNFFMDAQKYGIEIYVDATMVSEHMYEIMLNAQSLGRQIPRLEIVSPASVKPTNPFRRSKY